MKSKNKPKNQHPKKQTDPKQLLLKTFKDRYGNFDPKALTAFVSFVILIFIWIGDQFYGKKLNELIVQVFAFLVFSLLGLKSLPWKKQGMKTEDEKNEIDPI